VKILPEPILFEWDSGNIGKNFKKHNVSDKEWEEIFDSEQKLMFEDEKHSSAEKRYMIWGATKNGRRLSVFFTIRSDKVRIICARDMHKKERREYEKKFEANPEI